jgi:hypothetical protein
MPKATANAQRTPGMSGSGLKGGAPRRKAADRAVWCLVLEAVPGKPTAGNFREGGWKRERWSD